jgi:hypothetical protein
MNDLSNEYNIVMSEIKNLTVAYNPNDFYYYNATFSHGDKINTNNVDTICDDYINTSTVCNREDTKTNLENCYDKEVCVNRKNAMKIHEIQTNHDGADTRNNDTIVDYNRELLKSYNLAIGSLGILAIFYFLYK